MGQTFDLLARADVVVKVDQRYYRPTEVETLPGDPNKAKLGWVPTTLPRGTTARSNWPTSMPTTTTNELFLPRSGYDNNARRRGDELTNGNTAC